MRFHVLSPTLPELLHHYEKFHEESACTAGRTDNERARRTVDLKRKASLTTYIIAPTTWESFRYIQLHCNYTSHDSKVVRSRAHWTVWFKTVILSTIKHNNLHKGHDRVVNKIQAQCDHTFYHRGVVKLLITSYENYTTSKSLTSKQNRW